MTTLRMMMMVINLHFLAIKFLGMNFFYEGTHISYQNLRFYCTVFSLTLGIQAISYVMLFS